MTPKIAIVSTLAGVLTAMLSALIGPLNAALAALGIIMLLDYASGLIVAGVFHKSPKSQGGALESKAAFKGLCKKALIIVIVAAFHQADRIFGKTFFRDGAAVAFFVAELISVVENVGLVYPLPAFIMKALDWFQAKGSNLADSIQQNIRKPAEAEQDKLPDVENGIEAGDAK